MSEADGASKVLNIFDDIINRVKQARPVRTDGKQLGGGVVYSRLILGMPVDPVDYSHPWMPFGRSIDSSSTGRSKKETAAAEKPPAGPDPEKLKSDTNYAREYQAAYKTAQLCDLLLQVTDKETYLEYPVGKHLSFQYESIIRSMQGIPAPPMSADVKKQIDESQKVLYEVDSGGTVQIDQRTAVYETYLARLKKLAKAHATFAEKFAAAQADPNAAEVWPVTSKPYQQDIDDAYDDLNAMDPSKVERALDILGAVGISMQDHMISKARKLFDSHQVSLTILGSPSSYCYISPTGWSDLENDDDGWMGLHYEVGSTDSFTSSDHAAGSQDSSSGDHSHTDAEAHGGFMMYSASGGGQKTSDSQQFQGTSYRVDKGAFKNTAKNLKIDLEYMLCTIFRPWLVSDLFYLQNWYCVNNKKSAISDGTIANQKETAIPLLPMIPQQFLVVRNVTISAGEWGSDGEVLDQFYNGAQGSSSSTSSGYSASAGVSFCGFGAGGSVHHDQSHQQAQKSGWETKNATGHFGTTYENGTLTIKGAQIIAFLSDIVPPTPPLDDPELGKAADKGNKDSPATAKTDLVAAKTTAPSA